MRHDLDVLRDQLIGLLPNGREFARSAKDLARDLHTSTRIVGKLVEDAIIIDGYVIGSTCGADSPGYFYVVDEADLRAGCGHIIARAAQSFKRVRALERNWAEMNAGQTELFSSFAKAISGGAA